MIPRTHPPDAGERGVDLYATTGTTVRDVMLRHPKTLPVDASIRQAQAALDNDHVHLVLLTEGRRLAGTLTRTDLPPPGHSAQHWPGRRSWAGPCHRTLRQRWYTAF
jgi:CBS domain-containing protein